MKKKLISILLILSLSVPILTAASDVNDNNINIELESKIIEKQIGKGYHEKIVNENINKYKGRLRKSVKVSNEIDKQNKIYKESVASDPVISNSLELNYWKKFSNKYVYNLLPDNEKQFWDNLDITYQPYLSTDKDFVNEYIEAPGFTSFGDVYNSLFLYLMCNPQYYFLRPYVCASCSTVNGKSTYYGRIICYDAFESGEVRNSATVKLKNKLDSLVDEVNLQLTDWSKCKKIEELICAGVEYDRDVSAGRYDWDADNHLSQSIYSSLCSDITVCAGYAKAFSAVASAVGVTNASIDGSGHAWNIVNLDNNWYFIDVTWDDSSNKFTYFLTAKSRFNDSSHDKNSRWNEFFPDPVTSYHSFRSDNTYTYFSDNYVYFGNKFIMYNLGNGKINEYSNVYTLPTRSNPGVDNYKYKKYNITRSGYTLDGFYIGDMKINEKKKMTFYDDTIINVKWTPNTYNIQFFKNNKNAKGKMNKLKKIKYDEYATLPACKFTRKGYKFVGWSYKKKSNGKTDFNDNSTVINLTDENSKTINLYAVWVKE